MSQSMFPGCGIPDPSLSGSTDVAPGMKDSRIVPPATVVQILQPSLPPHLEIVVRSAETGYHKKIRDFFPNRAPQVRLLISPIII